MVIACLVTSQSIEATLSRTANEVFFKLENALYYADPLAVFKRQAAPRYETNLPHSVLKQWKVDRFVDFTLNGLFFVFLLCFSLFYYARFLAMFHFMVSVLILFLLCVCFRLSVTFLCLCGIAF